MILLGFLLVNIQNVSGQTDFHKQYKKDMASANAEMIIYDADTDGFYFRDKKTKKWGLYSGTRLLIPARYDSLFTMTTIYGYFAKKGDKWGAVYEGTEEEIAIPFEYDEIRTYRYHYAIYGLEVLGLRKGEKWYYKLNESTDIPAEDITSFNNGYSLKWKNDTLAYLAPIAENGVEGVNKRNNLPQALIYNSSDVVTQLSVKEYEGYFYDRTYVMNRGGKCHFIYLEDGIYNNTRVDIPKGIPVKGVGVSYDVAVLFVTLKDPETERLALGVLHDKYDTVTKRSTGMHFEYLTGFDYSAIHVHALNPHYTANLISFQDFTTKKYGTGLVTYAYDPITYKPRHPKLRMVLPFEWDKIAEKETKKGYDLLYFTNKDQEIQFPDQLEISSENTDFSIFTQCKCMKGTVKTTDIFGELFYMTGRSGDKYILLYQGFDRYGKRMTKCIQTDALPDLKQLQDNEYLDVYIDGKFARINMYVEYVISPEYTRIEDKDGTYSFVYKGDLKGLAMIDGSYFELIIPAEYQNLRSCMGGDLWLAQKDNKWGVLGYDGKQISVPFEYDEILDTDDGNTFPAMKNGKWGRITYNGKEIQPFIYNSPKEIPGN